MGREREEKCRGRRGRKKRRDKKIEIKTEEYRRQRRGGRMGTFSKNYLGQSHC